MGKLQSSEFDRLKKAIKEKHSRRFNAVLEVLPDEEFVDAFIKILEFVEPKLQRADINNHIDDELEIRITHTGNYPREEAPAEKDMPAENKSEDIIDPCVYSKIDDDDED